MARRAGGEVSIANDIALEMALFVYAKEAGLVSREASTITLEQDLVVTTSGEEYIQQCRDNGVEVPEVVFGETWTNRGSIEEVFISPTREAELWSWQSEDRDTTCLALPRWRDGRATLMGVICQGLRTGYSCFFDNPMNEDIGKGQLIGDREYVNSGNFYRISQFVGGYNLRTNPGGVCSDCHAGHNAFVVHPQEDPFLSLSSDRVELNPDRWNIPLIPEKTPPMNGEPERIWPHNPGPLRSIPGGGQCQGCHANPADPIGGQGGYFPVISSALEGYCASVLRRSFGLTMPNPAPGTYSRTAQIDWLLARCNDPPIYEPEGGGWEVPKTDLPDDPDFLSAPTLDEPLYGCARAIGVKGAILGAEIEVRIDASTGQTILPPVLVTDSEYMSISVPPLSNSDEVRVRQRVAGGPPSEWSNKVTADDYTLDYPNGLPAAEFAPDITHECAYNTAVRHVNGARLNVIKFPSGTSTITYGHAGGYTVAPGGGPFAQNNVFLVRQSLCGDPESVLSRSMGTDPAPVSLPRLTVMDDVYQGQQMIRLSGITEGAGLRVTPNSTPERTVLSWPTSWRRFNLGGVIDSIGPVVARQRLCSQNGQPVESPPITIPVSDCADIPAPVASPSRAGDETVTVVSYVPGARIKVIDQGGNEIGDGSGGLIRLRRPLQAGEAITVEQSLAGDECKGDVSFQYAVGQDDD